jgi:hypothetical protein
VQLGAARAEFSHDREPAAAEAPAEEAKTEPKPAPRRRAVVPTEPKADRPAPQRSEGSAVIEAPVMPSERDSGGSRSIEAPAKPAEPPSSEPKEEVGPEDEPNPYEPATPPAPDYGI